MTPTSRRPKPSRRRRCATLPCHRASSPSRANARPRRRDRDRPQFKGIFVRHLYELYRHRPRSAYRDFILANATSLWQNSRNHRNQLGLSWTGPFDRADAVRQSSALDALTAAVGVARPPSGAE